MEETKKQEIKKKRNRILWPQDRISGFTDGVFSFAVTLLVLNLINLSIPIGNHSLLPLVSKDASVFISFTLTFYVIARLWMSHVRLFAIIKESDNIIVRLNNTLLFFVTTFPFVALVLGGHINDMDAVIMYDGCFAIIGILLYLIGKHAYKKHLFISDYLNKNFIKIFAFFSLSTPAVFVVSIFVALLSPLAAEITWISILFLRIGFKYYYKKNPSEEIEIDEL